MLVYCDTDAFGTATVTMAGGTSLKGFSRAEGRYLTSNEDLANPLVLSGGPGDGGLVNLPLDWTASKDIWLKGAISGPGGLHITGTNRTATLSADNTFEGGVILECGVWYAPNKLQIASYTALGTGTLTVGQTTNTGTGGGVLAVENLDGTAADKNSVESPNGVTNDIVIQTGRYFNVSGENVDDGLLLSGEISGEGTLRKFRNASILTLSGDNTYTGGTIVEVGTLKVEGSLAGGTVSVATQSDNTTAILSGTGDIAGPVSVAATSGIGRANIITGGDFGTTGTLSIGGLTLGAGAIGYFDIASDSDMDYLDVTGDLTADSGAIITLSTTVGLDYGDYGLIGYSGANTSAPIENYRLQILETGDLVASYALVYGTNVLNLRVGAASVWTGALTNDWNTGGNWDPNAVPGVSDALVFGNEGSTGAVDLGDTDRTANGISFTSSVNTTIASTQNKTLTITSGTVDVEGTHVISASIADNGGNGLYKAGDGTLTLAGTNTYTGLTDVAAGTLKLGSAGALPNGDVTVGGTLDLNGNSPTVKALNGSGTITATGGASTLTVGDGDASATFSGTIKDGTHTEPGGTVVTYGLGAPESGTFFEGGTFTSWIPLGNLPAGSFLQSVSIDTVLESTDNENWTQELAVLLDPTPETPGEGGKLICTGWEDLGSDEAAWWNGGDGGAGTPLVDTKDAGVDFSTDIDLNTAEVFLVNTFGGPVLGGTWSGTVSVTYGEATTVNPVALVKVGTGTLLIENANTYSGGTTVTAGEVRYNSTDAFGTGTITLAGGTTFAAKAGADGGNAEGRYTFANEDIANDIVLSGGLVNLPLGHGEAKDIWFNGNISGAGGLHLTGTHRAVTLSGNNTFEGGVTLESSTPSYNNKVQIASYTGFGTGTVTVNQTANDYSSGIIGVENLDGNDPDQNGVSSTGGVTNPIEILAGKQLNVSTNSDSKTLLLSGPISGEGSLHKTRHDQWTMTNNTTVILGGANTYTGGTLVTSGTLTINGSLADASMTVSIAPDNGASGPLPATVDGIGTLTFNIDDATCDLIQVMNGGTLDITNLNINFNAANLTGSSYVLVDWEIEAAEGETAIEPGILIGDAFASESNVPTGWMIDYGSTQITLIPGQIGDTNLDGVVDVADYMAIKRNFGMASGAAPADGDVNNDGAVDWYDLQILQDHFGEGTLNASKIPEPATMMLLLTAGLPVLLRRRQNRG